jgi:hypothetical protein
MSPTLFSVPNLKMKVKGLNFAVFAEIQKLYKMLQKEEFSGGFKKLANLFNICIRFLKSQP